MNELSHNESLLPHLIGNETHAEARVNTTNHCICIGYGAGLELTTEEYEFCFSVGFSSESQYRTTMTPEEFEIVNRVVRRAIGQKLVGDNHV
jgi:hypothetical protein